MSDAKAGRAPVFEYEMLRMLRQDLLDARKDRREHIEMVRSAHDVTVEVRDDAREYRAEHLAVMREIRDELVAIRKARNGNGHANGKPKST